MSENINWSKVGNVMLAGAIPGIAFGSGVAFLILPIITTYILILTAAGISIPASLFLGLFFAKPQTALPPGSEKNSTGQLTE